MENSQREYNPILNILLTLGLVFLGMQFIGPFIGLFIAIPFYPGPITQMVTDLQDMTSHPELRPTLMLLQGAAAIVGLIIVPTYILKRQQVNVVGFFKGPIYPQILLLLFFIVISATIVDSPIAVWNANVKFPSWLSWFGDWARRFEDSLKATTEFVTVFDSWGSFLTGFFVIAVLPAIGEELVFRGIVQRDLQRATSNPHIAIWLSAAIFSAFHIQFFGFFPRLFLGVLFGYLYFWSGSLIVPMIAHFINNGLIVVGLFLYQRKIVEVDMTENEAAPWSAILGATVVFAATMFLFKKFYDQHPPITHDLPNSED